VEFCLATTSVAARAARVRRACVCGTVRPLQLALTGARGISLISNLEDRELSVFLLLLALKMKTKHSFIHHPCEQEHPVDFFLFGTRPSSSWRATAIFALRSFFFCSGVSKLIYKRCF
jgi:hypothetical protein